MSLYLSDGRSLGRDASPEQRPPRTRASTEQNREFSRQSRGQCSAREQHVLLA